MEQPKESYEVKKFFSKMWILAMQPLRHIIYCTIFPYLAYFGPNPIELG